MSRQHRLVAAAAFATLVLALAGAFSSTTPPSAAAVGLGDGRFSVEATRTQDPHLILELDLPSDHPNPGRVSILVPRGLNIYPQRPTGSAVGTVTVYAHDLSFGTSTATSLQGRIVQQPPPASAPACTSANPSAVWNLQLSLLGQPLDVPLYLSTAGPADPPDTNTRIDLCAPLLPQTSPSPSLALPITSLELDLGGLATPSAHGSYLWRALVTPLATDRRSLLPQATYELRALTPVPNRLTLLGRYQPRTHTVLLTGRLTVNGTPRPQTTIELTTLIRRVTSKGVFFDDRFAGIAKTNADGRYSLRVQIRKTAGFVANAEPAVRRCTGPPAAPAGCLNTTLPTAQSDPITISLPRP